MTISPRIVLSRYAAADLAAGVAALQLVPRNANNLYRLEHLALLISTLPFDDGKPRMAANRWKGLLNPPAGDPSLAMEDPHEDVFCSCVTFHGGSYRVLPGSAVDSAFVLRMALSALARMEHTPLIWDLIQEALAVLKLSDSIAASADLDRLVIPEGKPGGTVTVPARDRLDLLKSAVRFSRTRLDATFGADARDRLAALLTEVSETGLDVSDVDEDHLFSTPILDTGDELIVVLPTALTVAARHNLACALVRSGLQEDFWRAFQATVLSEAAQAMFGTLASQATDLVVPQCDPRVAEAFFSIDVDKLAHLLVLTDDLGGYDPAAPFGEWTTGPTEADVEGRIGEVRTELLGGQTGVTGILHILVFQPLGRLGGMGLANAVARPDCPILLVRTSELGVMARASSGDPLAFWKFATAQDQLREGTALPPTTTTLDEFSLYRSNDSSFYLSDEKLPDLLVIPPGESAHLRWSDATDHDLHAVSLPDGRHVADVSRRYAGSNVPIYVTDPLQFREPMFLVEGLGIPIWVTGRGGGQLLFLLCESVAYWVWQLLPDVADLVGALAGGSRLLLVEITLDDPGEGSPDEASADDEEWLAVTLEAPATIGLQLGAGVRAQVDQPDNRAERAIVRALVDSINGLSGEPGSVLDSQQIVEARAPVGPKRMITAFNPDVNWALFPGELPRHRLTHANDVSRCLDGLGSAVAEALGRGTGRLSDDQRTPALNRAVEIQFDAIKDMVESLDRQGLLEFLVAHDEALIREKAQSSLNLVSRAECFGEDPDYIAKVQERLGAMTNTNLASRFLIEYAVAQPPEGRERISLSTYDRLLALSADLTNKGMLSDAIHYGLAEPSIDILPSGRIGVDREDQFIRALADFRPIRVAGAFTAAKTEYAKNWRDLDSEVPDVGVFGDLENAARVEFDFALSEIADFFASMGRLSTELRGEPKSCSVAEARAHVAENTRLSPDRASAILDLFTLKARDSFVPEGMGSSVYPWRFNRELSYLRRPFLSTGNDDAQLVWGIRNLWRAGAYLLDLCTSGRLRAKTPEMKAYASAMRQDSADTFNDMVGGLFNRAGLMIRTKVEKVGGLRIERAFGEPLGDIDVLAVNASRRRVLAIEVKDFSQARTPTELANQIAEAFSAQNSATTRHHERVTWLREHMKELKRWLGVDDQRAWKVRPLIVTSRDLLSASIGPAGIPVMSFRTLSETGYRWLSG